MMDVNQFENLVLPVEMIIQFVFYFMLGAYAIFSGILYYHWSAYGSNIKVTTLTFIVYAVTTIPLFVTMGIIAFNI